MIITKITGRLGNEMFQYAIGRMLAHKNNTELKLDLFSFEKPPIWPYTLNRFNIIENPATKKEVEWFKKYNWKKGRFWFWYNRLIADRTRYADERQFNFEPWIITLKDPVYLDGLWQTEKYFKEIEAIIRKEFTLKNPLSEHSKTFEHKIRETEAVSLHARRKDYVSDKIVSEWLGACSVEYYNEAIKEIGERVKNPSFFVFSDDPTWVRKNIVPPFPTVYVTGNEERPEEDMYLMSRCKYHIISNSSFAWWGAWLNPNLDKIVIAPRRWFKNKKNDTSDVVPKTWVKI